jgi:hypothetical protein
LSASTQAGGGQKSERGGAQIKEFGRMTSLPGGHAEQQFTCQQEIAVPAPILLTLKFRREHFAISVLAGTRR